MGIDLGANGGATAALRWRGTTARVLGLFAVLIAGGLIFCGPCGTLSAQSIEAWVQRQAQVQQVVETVLPATVAVTDGVGFGSGVVVNPEGLVLTAGHVMTTGGRDYRVIFPNGRQVRARPLGKNLNVDAGMVQITEPGPWPYVPMSDSQASRGDWCIGLGHPGGYELGRLPPVRVGRVLDFSGHQLVTDCALIGGDSGGPLFDLNGRLIAIHSSIGDSIAENRHVTVDTFRQHWSRIQAGQSWGRLPDLDIEASQRGAMGIVLQRDSAPAAIAEVHDDSAGSRSGLLPGDKILALSGRPIANSNELIELMSQYRAGETIDLDIRRDGQRLVLEVTLERRR